MLSINTNLSSLIVQNSMKQSTNRLNTAIERLTTGFKINHAKDNAANYNIATNMTTQIGSYEVAEDNTMTSLDLLTTASDSLALIQDRIQRLRDLQEQAMNGTYGEQSLQAINEECCALVDEINRVYETTEFNGISLFLEPTEMPDGTVAVVKETDAKLDTTFKDMGITSTGFEVYDSDGNLVQTYDIEENDTIQDFFDTLQTHGFTTNLRNGVITIESPTLSYLEGDLVDELGIETKDKLNVSYTTQSNTILTTTTTETTQTTTIFTTTTSVQTVTETIPSYGTTEVVTTSPGFMKQITVRDTSTMTALSTVNTSDDLADGTYKISTIEEMSILATMTNAGLVSAGDEFVLANDIDMTSWGTYIGINEGFCGTFDGNGNTIINDDRCIFNRIKGCVKNLSIKSTSATYGHLLTYFIDAGGLVSNIYLEYTASATRVEMDRVTFGIAQYNYGTVESCYVKSNCTDSGNMNNSGILYWNFGTIKNSYTNASGDNYALVLFNEGLIENSYGSFSSQTSAIMAADNTGTIKNAYVKNSSGTVTDSSSDWDGTEFTYSLVKPVAQTGNGEQVVTTTASVTITTPVVTTQTVLATVTINTVQTTTLWSTTTVATTQTMDKQTYKAIMENVYAPGEIGFLVGTNASPEQNISVNMSFKLDDISGLKGIGVDNYDYLSQIDSLLKKLAEKQVYYGAMQNRMMSVLEEISVKKENLVSSRSTLRDADIADISSEYIRQQILQQASATLLSTANQSPSIALQLI